MDVFRRRRLFFLRRRNKRGLSSLDFSFLLSLVPLPWVERAGPTRGGMPHATDVSPFC